MMHPILSRLLSSYKSAAHVVFYDGRDENGQAQGEAAGGHQFGLRIEWRGRPIVISGHVMVTLEDILPQRGSK